MLRRRHRLAWASQPASTILNRSSREAAGRPPAHQWVPRASALGGVVRGETRDTQGRNARLATFQPAGAESRRNPFEFVFR